jgi:tyrosine-protein kinase Etk/Wzc
MASEYNPPFSQQLQGVDTDDQFDLRELAGVVLAGWPWVIGLIGAAVVLALAYLYITPPTFKTDALVQVESNSNSARVAFTQVADAFGTELPVAAEAEILRSRFVLGKVVDRLGLDIIAAPKRFPLLGDALARRYRGNDFASAPFWLRLFSSDDTAWGGERITVSTFQVPRPYQGAVFQLIAGEDGAFELLTAEGDSLGQGRLGEQFSAMIDEDSQLLLFVQELRARPGTSFRVRKIRREQAIGALQRNLAVIPSRSAIGMVDLTYTDTSSLEAARILTEVLSVYQSQNVERRSAEAEQTLAFLNEQLPELRKQVETAEAKLNQFKIEQGTADLAQETAAVLTRSVELEQASAELQQQRNEALQRFTSNHPVVQAIDSQLIQLDTQIRQVTARIRQLPDIEQKALQLSRDLQVNTALYVSLLNRTQELEVVKSGTIGSIRIIDLPVQPAGPAKPKKGLVLMLSIILGGMAGVGIAFVVNAMKNGVEDPSEVEKKLGLATYGAIPYSVAQGRVARILERGKTLSEGILAQQEPTGPAMEAIRSVRTALHFAQMDAPNNILMLTGPEPSLGKSFVSINLGAALAQGGSSVVVVDADMRRGHIHKMVLTERAPGLSDVLSGNATLDDALFTTAIERLQVIATGTIPPNPSELLISDRFVDLLKTLSARFDHVIVDTPPVLAVTDAAIVGRHAGITLLVLKAGQHPIRLIQETANRLLRAGVQVRGTLFNQMGLSRRSRYGYKYGYYYSGYKYKYETAKDEA